MISGKRDTSKTNVHNKFEENPSENQIFEWKRRGNERADRQTDEHMADRWAGRHTRENKTPPQTYGRV